MVKSKVNNIGIEAKSPKQSCDDVKCPWHGHLKIRGRLLKGKIISTKGTRSAIVLREYFHKILKYERSERRKSHIAVHNPDCIDVHVGDDVQIAECRPLSKTKKFVIVEIINKQELK